jgi:hypothetical protein
MIVRWLNEAQRKICWEGGILVSAWTASTVANQEAYSVPSDWIKVRGVFIANAALSSYRKLVPIRMEQRDARLTTGTPLYYYSWGLNVSGNNVPTINLNPIPDTSGSSDLVMYGQQIGADMVSGGQAPEVMYQWQDALSCYAAMRWYQRLGKDWRPQALDCASEWQDWVNKAKAYKNPMGIDTPTSMNDDMAYTVNLD